MSEKNTELHELVLDGLIARLKSGEAKASDYSNALKYLKDNPRPTPTEEARKKQLEQAMSVDDLPFKSFN